MEWLDLVAHIWGKVLQCFEPCMTQLVSQLTNNGMPHKNKNLIASNEK